LRAQPASEIARIARVSQMALLDEFRLGIRGTALPP
jgi:hypothetical protein